MEKNTKLIINLLNDSSKVVGSKQVLKGISEDKVRCAIISEDADDNLKLKIASACTRNNVEILYAPTMEWLGFTVGIKVGAATVGILKSEA